ncbi:SRPBCC family protein [Acinetobacter sp. A3.8]|uniref:SRPBCC family protein n=1 Tax=Acinetobacter sedimenti TaxID=2919922 RepID=A0A9X1WXR9_9GAMM|nr:SRPBCC family protein [Acinetobacter sedimenti]MCJ8146458.1 SRPBCC family protein [Acinetobacter sedimenti]
MTKKTSKMIAIEQKFNRPVAEVFEVLSKHASYNRIFKPIQVVRIKDATDPQRPDGVGSVRKMGFGLVKPIQEQITKLVPNELIEYKIIKNPLVRHHLGRLTFTTIDENTTQLVYSIEFDGRIPFSSRIVLSQLKLAVGRGMAGLAKSMQ